LEAQLAAAVEALKEGVYDCETIGHDEDLDMAERRTWIHVARKLRAALARIGEGK
jgi:hypothetical protein